MSLRGRRLRCDHALQPGQPSRASAGRLMRERFRRRSSWVRTCGKARRVPTRGTSRQTQAPQTTESLHPRFPGSAPEFLARMAALMGLPPGAAPRLQGSASVRGREGLLCGVCIERRRDALCVRPQVCLPITAHQLDGTHVERLLVLQQAMTDELGWMVRLSGNGHLLLSTLEWLREPEAAVDALDLGQAIGLEALRELFGELDTTDDSSV